MKFIYLDATAGISGDMMLGALLDLGANAADFRKKMASLQLPVQITIKEVKRASLRAKKVNIKVENHHIHRKWEDIETLIRSSTFSQAVKEQSLAIFRRLFEAESRVHGHKFHLTHLHEAGADDALIDIMGTCYLAEKLNIREFYSSPLNVGSGSVKTSHGVLPVPPPAVAELLQGIPVYSAHAQAELTTPTGAAIISTLALGFTAFPELCYEKIGCGAGGRDFPDFPNILRVFFGESSQYSRQQNIYQIETNIDDANPQILADFIDRALAQGALDVFLTPVVMKKNRLASKLTVLTEAKKLDELIRIIFTETTSIGVRYFPVERRVLERTLIRVKVLGEDIAVKVSTLAGNEVTIQPEYNDCRRAAKKKQIPVKKIIELALHEYNQSANKGTSPKSLKVSPAAPSAKQKSKGEGLG